MDTGLTYHVYQNPGQVPLTCEITSLDRFYKLPLMKKFHLFSQELKGNKVVTWYTHTHRVDGYTRIRAKGL